MNDIFSLGDFDAIGKTLSFVSGFLIKSKPHRWFMKKYTVGIGQVQKAVCVLKVYESSNVYITG